MWDTLHKIFTEFTGAFAGLILAVIHGPDALEKIMKFFGWIDEIERRQGERRQDMGALGYIELISKIATEAPILLPDAMKLLTDLNQFNADFQKLLSDFQGIKAAAIQAQPGVAAPAK